MEKLAEYSCNAALDLNILHTIAQDVVARSVPGDFVECGVFNGGSAATIAAALLPTDKQSWLYDSFEGLPPTTERDNEAAQEWVGKCKGEIAKVQEAMALVGFPSERTVFRKGWFQDTFSAEKPAQVALLHVDADWYESVSLCLRTFYPLMPDGGVIVLDDFGYWEGCREAYYDFCKEFELKPLLERSGRSQAFWVKSKTHNRV